MIRELRENRVLLVMLPDSESYSVPTEAELAETMKSVDAEQIEAFVDNAKTEPLIPCSCRVRAEARRG